MTEGFIPSTAPPSGLGPLRRFRGNLQSFEAVDKEGTNDDGKVRTYKQIQFKFMDLEVLEATEPYPFPQAQINITYSPPDAARGASRWEAWAKSLRERLPEVAPDERIPAIVGKVQEWALLPFELRTRQESTNDEGQTVYSWGPAQVDCWQIVEIEGVAAPEDLTDYILKLADGKSESEFNQALLTDPKITPRVDIISSITERQLLPTLLAAGRLTQDTEGVLHTTKA